MANRGAKTKLELAEIAARRIRVEEMFVRGEPQWKIAQKESVSNPTITRDIAFVLKEWQAKRVEYCEQAVQIELGKIARLELEYWNAWVRSCEVAEKTSTKLVRDGDGDRTEAGTVKEWQGGDPRFLEGVRWCIDRRLQLFGKDAPTKQELGLPGSFDAESRRTRLTGLFTSIRKRIGTNGVGILVAPGGNGDSSLVRGNGEHGAMEDGTTPRSDRPGDNGHDRGPDGTATDN